MGEGCLDSGPDRNGGGLVSGRASKNQAGWAKGENLENPELKGRKSDHD